MIFDKWLRKNNPVVRKLLMNQLEADYLIVTQDTKEKDHKYKIIKN